MVAAAVAGGYLGAGIVSKLPRRTIQIGMGVALLIAAALFVMKIVGVLPPGGNALGLSGGVLVFAVVVNFLLGALMQLGIGLYAPCLMLVSLLGMNPIAAFPIMMASCACLMPVGSLKFIREHKYDKRTAIGLALGGIPGVLLAAFVVKSLPLQWLYWLVVIVVLYAAILMLRSALQPQSVPCRRTTHDPTRHSTSRRRCCVDQGRSSGRPCPVGHSLPMANRSRVDSSSRLRGDDGVR